MGRLIPAGTGDGDSYRDGSDFLKLEALRAGVAGDRSSWTGRRGWWKRHHTVERERT